MIDSTPPDETAPALPAAQSGQDATKGLVKWTREQRLALWANIASSVNVVAALAAFVLLIQTLRVTQDTLVVSQRAGEETRRQADIAQEALIASSRPWIMLTDVKPSSLASDDEAGISFQINLSVKNVGHSPAQNVSVSSRLLIIDFDPPADQAMVSVCQDAREGPFVIPGQVLFPDQSQSVQGDIPINASIEAERVWAARTARINSIHERNMANGKPQRAEAWAEALSKFPFYAPLSFVGCINYRSSDSKTLYQTSFRFDIAPKSDDAAFPRLASFPLLSGEPPATRYPEPAPYDPDVVMVFARKMQRVVPGEQIKLATPFYGGTFAD